MAEQLSLRTNAAGDIYVYMEGTGGNSMAVGSDTANSVFTLNVSTASNVLPASGTASMVIHPGANGDLGFRPHGSGKSEFITGNVRISLGNMDLQTTQSTGLVGLISYVGNKFIHNFGDRCAWIGQDAGNLSAVSANDNNGMGYQTLSSLTTGTQNNAIGNQAGLSLTTGQNNNFMGYQAAKNLVSGQNNVIIGEQSGFAYTTAESSNILLNNLGTVGESHALRIGSATGTGVGELNKAFIQGTYGITPAGGAQQLMIMDSSGQMGTTTGGSFGINTIHTESGDAVPSAGAITITGGNNIGTSGSGSTVTVVVDNIVGQTNGGASIVPFVATATGNISETPGGAATMNSGTQTLSISSDASATSVNVATGAAVKTLVLGSTNSTSASTLQSGSGALNVTSTNGALTVNSGTGTLGVSTDASNTTVNIATGGAVKTSTFGSTNSTSATTVQSGSGALALTSTNGTWTGNSGTGTLALSSDASNTTVNLATGSAIKTVTLGSTNSSSLLALKYGTADFSLASATGNVIVAQDTGEITYPLQPSFYAYLAGNASNVTGDGTAYTIAYDSELYDRNSDFASNTFTAPVTGLYYLYHNTYLFSLGAGHTAAVSQIVTTARSYLTGVYNPANMRRSGVNDLTIVSGVLAPMTAGDTATITITISNSTKTVGVGGTATNSFFCGYLVA